MISLLPDELVISCLALVSRSDYKALSLVSKRFRSLVVSHELYKARSLLGYTKNFLYVCLSTGHNNNKTLGKFQNPSKNPTSRARWFILRHAKPKILEKTLMTQVFSFFFQPPKRSTVVALDWGIYIIGGLISGKPTSDVLLLDCRTNTSRKLPSMAVARSSAAAGVVDGKIYVFGGCKNTNGEVFDPMTQTWSSLMPMTDKIKGSGLIRKSLVMEEKVYGFGFSDGSIVYYSPRECKWGRANLESETYLQRHQCVMVEKLLYSLDDSGKLFWYEKKEFKWKEVKGLDLGKLFGSVTCFHKLSNFGENIVVFWCEGEWYASSSKIWCAEISLERRGDEIWGKVEWFDRLNNTLKYYCVTHSDRVAHSFSVNL